MNRRILVTGSSGLIGSALAPALISRGVEVVRLDTRASGVAHGDVLDRERVAEAVKHVEGIVHLAAVSRVIWGERDPERCWKINVDGLRNVLESAASSSQRPWIVFASSREVYGQADRLPVAEHHPRQPVNVYGRSKVEGERLVTAAQGSGVRACTIRLSNVFGSTTDHADRVAPAFARAAALGADMRVDGPDNTFDFTHVDDVTRGIVTLTELLGAGDSVPEPVHLVTGTPTTLGELAATAKRIAATDSAIRFAPSRDFDVARFCGDPRRTRSLLGWKPRVGVDDGLGRLIDAFRGMNRPSHPQLGAP